MQRKETQVLGRQDVGRREFAGRVLLMLPLLFRGLNLFIGVPARRIKA